MVAAGLRQAAQTRERAQGEGHRRVPPRKLQGTLPHPRVTSVLRAQPLQAASSVAESALRGGGEAAGAAAGCRRQVPRATQVPAAQDHLGRRGDELLLQGEIPLRAARVVHPQPIPQPQGEEGTGRGHGTHHHASVQLVQEPAPARPRRRAEGRVSIATLIKHL